MDKLYYNGPIITMEEDDGCDSVAYAPEAVLVRDGEICAVGAKDGLLTEASADVLMVDLKGACLMPSFMDAHSHFIMNGRMSRWADLSGCRSSDEIVEVLKRYVERNSVKDGAPVIGFGYDHNFLREGRHPDRYVLDQVSTRSPVVILHVSAHMACANSKALQMAGISAAVRDPEGGKIGRVHGGMDPDGYLEEAGMVPIQAMLSSDTGADPVGTADEMQQAYLSYGITTVQEGAASRQDIQLLENMADAGLLKIDVVAYPLMGPDGEDILRTHKDQQGRYKDHLKLGGYKMILDGSPQGRSAWLRDPYLHGEEGYRGYPRMRDEMVRKLVRRAIMDEQQILAHCNGDAASEQFLDAYEAAVEDTGLGKGLRPVMVHCQTVRNDQMERMARSGMIASMFIGHVWYWGDVHLKNLGDARGNHISPARDALDRKVMVTFHQDSPVTRPDMLHTVWCAVNRLSRSGKVIGEDQKISVYEALRAVTINVAYQYFEEDRKGSIAVGKKADLVILDRSPLETDVMDIKEIRVVETIKDGETVYRRK